MMYRLFIAIDLPENVRRQIRTICTGLEHVKWVSDEQSHLTLRFIGEADGLLLEDLCRTLSELEADSFSLQIQGTGYFPPRREPKVLWAGLKESPELKKLYGKINKALVSCGIMREKRKFTPHITLGRIKGESSQSVAVYLNRHHRFKSPPFTVDQYHLYTSRLTPRGAIHEKLASFLLD